MLRLKVFVLSVIYAKRSIEVHFGERHCDECRYAEVHYSDCCRTNEDGGGSLLNKSSRLAPTLGVT
jgi:hypothetical protein